MTKEMIRKGGALARPAPSTSPPPIDAENESAPRAKITKRPIVIASPPPGPDPAVLQSSTLPSAGGDARSKIVKRAPLPAVSPPATPAPGGLPPPPATPAPGGLPPPPVIAGTIPTGASRTIPMGPDQQYLSTLASQSQPSASWQPQSPLPVTQARLPPPISRGRWLAAAVVLGLGICGGWLALRSARLDSDTELSEPLPVPSSANATVDGILAPQAPLELSPLVIDRLKRATVVVRTSLVSGRGGEQRLGMGAGFFVSEDGLIATNAHVIDDAGKGLMRVSIETADSARVDRVQCIGSDKKRDLALLQVSMKSVDYLALSPVERVRETTQVAVVGHPLDELWSVSTGRVTGYRVQEGQPFYGLDARIEPGNSGGPVALWSGEVIGVSDWKIRNTEMNYAIPASELAAFMRELSGRMGQSCGVDQRERW